MCAIVGIFNHSSNEDIQEPILARMRDSMTHRGPDDCGMYINPAQSAGLAHRRLSVIDLSADARQPMSDCSGRFWVTFNGEIYNYRELRSDLEQAGIRFRTQSDTEVLLYLYEKHGKDMVRYLRGMFAFGIWDEKRKTLFLARDRLGVKPLYFADRGGSFVFASEIKGILASGKIVPNVNLEALNHYLSFLTTPAPTTLFAGISKLPAAHRMTVDKCGRIEVEQWWSPLSKKQRVLPEETYVRDIRDLLAESIRYRMVSDVPIGAFLSGGIDSSTIVALMPEMMNRPVQTFSVGFEGQQKYNEFEFAHRVAKRFQTDHFDVEIGLNDLVNFLPQLVYHQDEPLADPVCVPVYYLAKLAKAQGVTVCQVGEGSDELFCGYRHWGHVLSIENMRRFYSILPKHLRRGASFLINQIENDGSMRRELIRRASYGEPIFWSGEEAFYEPHKRRILNTDVRRKIGSLSSAEVVSAYYREFLEGSGTPDQMTWMSFINLKLRLPELLLMRVDKMTMATAVESRVPFLDHNLVEYVMSIPQNRKLPQLQLKYLLKKAVRGVIPDEIIDRRKQGFDVPVVEWTGLGPIIRKRVLDFARRIPLFDSSQLSRLFDEPSGHLPWYLFNFVVWHEHWIEDLCPAKV
jgi:asparagine synthase (glutamine-hydrolysing)